MRAQSGHENVVVGGCSDCGGGEADLEDEGELEEEIREDALERILDEGGGGAKFGS